MPEQIKQFFQSIFTYSLGNILPAVILAAVGVAVIAIVGKITATALKRSKLEKAAHTLILSLVRVVLTLLLCLIVASALGIDVTGIIALASVLTLAVSLALQTALANLIGGFTLLYTHPFTSGEFVEIAGKSGTVKEIGLTYTKLATPDNCLISIPNSSVVAAEIINYTVTGTRRVDITVSASYDSPVEKVLSSLLRAADLPTTLADPAPFVGVTNYGDSAIEYVLRIWTTAEDYWPTKFEASRKIKEVFDEDGIVLTYPHLNVHLDK